ICDGTRADNTYWESLVPDADGAGRSMAQLCRDALLAIMLYGRAAFYVRFPAEIGIPSRPETLAARLAVLPAPAIEDWELDERGDYAWVRLHTIETIRSAPEKQPRMELHRWTYLWPDRQVVYSASKEVRAAWKRDTVLTPIVIQHDFGRLPVFPVRAPASAYVMGRIADVLGALFARETSLSFALNSAAYPLLVLRLAASDPKQIVASELAALRLQVGEEAQYLSPPSDAFAALFRDVERLRLALYEALHSLALSAPAQTQNPRQSAAAKALDRDPLETLLDSFAWPVRDALARALTAIAEYRREDPGGIRLIGFERPERIAMENLRQIVLGDGIPVAIGPGMEEGEAEGEADEHEQ
ncbi:MAG: hypothetical protein N3A38_15645, partial [Planctomycetota bacterium]|nr:hypothetical protein [Planctomycetota bacterium]